MSHRIKKSSLTDCKYNWRRQWTVILFQNGPSWKEHSRTPGWEEQIQTWVTCRRAVQAGQNLRQVPEAAHTGRPFGLSDLFFIWQIRAQSKITCFIKVKCGFNCTWIVESWHINCSRPETPNSWLTEEYQSKMVSFFPPTLSYKWKALSVEIEKWIRSLFKYQ